MVTVIKHVGHETVKTFILDKPQPVKNPVFMLFPVEGTLENRGFKGDSRRKHISVKSYKELLHLLD